jgi:GNAT superfamily N-acetyltransferase
MVEIREMAIEELDRVVEVDVSESGDIVYYYKKGGIEAQPERWQRPPRSQEEWQTLIDRWRAYLTEDGGAFLGAFDWDILAGIAVVRYNLTPSQAELAGLFVSQDYRRQGIAAQLTAEIIRLAKESGAEELYVSATPSRSAVGFYQSVGFTLADDVNPDLFALEPEDIHMVMSLMLGNDMKTLSAEAFNRARNFIYTKARPLERDLFAFRFEGGKAEEVLASLAAFQNEDGGFGHALEPDLRTPTSSALATGEGLRILREVECPADHPSVRKAVAYLMATYDDEQHVWRVAPHDANDYPHAQWWHDDNGSLASVFDGFRIIPRAEIVALLHHYIGLVPSDWLAEVTARTVSDVLMIEPFGSGGGDDLVYASKLLEVDSISPEDRKNLLTRLRDTVSRVVNRDSSKWGYYLVSPLKVVNSPQSPFADLIPDAVQQHLDYQIEHQSEQGAWDPVWEWDNFYPEEWSQARVEWQGRVTLDTLTTLRSFGRLADHT